MTPLALGSVIGILGGGQLGRIMALEAAKLGFDVHIYCPEPRSPAARVAAFETVAEYDDARALEKFANACDVVTYEFENVPARSVSIIEGTGRQVRPGAKSLEMSQDRVKEKKFLQSLGIPTVDFHAVGVDGNMDLNDALVDFGWQGILKTRRDGYDGKGQVRIKGQEGAAKAQKLADETPCILEAFAPFDLEISAVVARTKEATLVFDISQNIHVDGVLSRSIAPAKISDDVRAKAIDAGTKLADALGHVGVLALEFFVMPDGTLHANEFAPRVHNSGHWTPEACMTGQFEQHIRAVAGWPLGPVDRIFDVEMVNLLGDEVAQIPAGFDASTRLVSYGKHEAKAGRKMAHITHRKGKTDAVV